MKRKLLSILLFGMALLATVMAKTVGTSCLDKTADYTVPAGARGIVFIFRTSFSGTINGVSWAATTDASYSPPIQDGDTFAAIPVTVSAGTVRICVSR